MLLFILPLMVTAQTPLTLEDAIRTGLLNNYQIRLVKNDSAINAKNATAGAAGMLPTLSMNGLATQSTNNLNQKFSTGLEVQRNGVGSGNINGNIALNWTLFDGFKMF